MQRDRLLKLTIVLGIVIVFTGLLVHSESPSIISPSQYDVQAGSYSARQLTMERGLISTGFGLYMRLSLNSSSAENFTVLLVTPNDYNSFSRGEISLDELDPVMTAWDRFDVALSLPLTAKKEFSLAVDGDVDLYLLFINSRTTEDLAGGYYLSIIPNTYNTGILVIILGTALVFAALLVKFTGWKKTLVACIGINTGVFLLRLFTFDKSLFIPPYFSEIIHLEMYEDYVYWYMRWIEDIFNNGAIPYANLSGYIYTPLFIVTIVLFALIPFLPYWKMGIAIFLYNIGIGYLVYAIIRKSTSRESTATRAMVFYYLNPITLIYGSFCWLNPPAFVFYLVLAYYLAVSRKYSLSIVSLAVSFMYKQFAVFFAPLLVLAILRERGITANVDRIKEIARYVIIFAVTTLVIALPFLIIDFNGFLNSAFFYQSTVNSGWLSFVQILPWYNQPVNFNTFFVLVGIPQFTTALIANLLVSYVFVGGTVLACYALYWWQTREINNQRSVLKFFNVQNVLFWSLILSLCIFVFYPRGSFKYYLIPSMAFLALTLDKLSLPTGVDGKLLPANLKNLITDKDFILQLVVSVIVFLLCRYVYFMVILAWLAYLVMRNVMFVRDIHGTGITGDDTVINGSEVSLQ